MNKLWIVIFIVICIGLLFVTLSFLGIFSHPLNCYDFQIATDTSICLKAPEEQFECRFPDGTKGRWSRDSCYDSVAENTLNPELCTDSMCREGVYTKMAIKNKDASLCDKIEDVNSRVYCKFLVKIDCESVAFPTHCYEYVAIETQNYSLCDEILSYLSSKNIPVRLINRINHKKCIAISKRDPELCKEIPSSSSEFFDMCYEDIAAYTKNPAVCNRISNENLNLKYRCPKIAANPSYIHSVI